MKLTFLGTSAMVPTKERNHSAAFLEIEPYGILVDCGEGTQRQLNIANIRPTRITHILISHWHGDHVLGLPGLLQTLSAMNPGHKITIAGPGGSRKHYEHMKKAFAFEPALEIQIVEAERNPVIKTDKFSVEFSELEHSVKTIGYRVKTRDRRRINTHKIKELGLKEGPWLTRIQEGKSVEVNGKKIRADDVSYVVKGKVVSFVTDTLMCPGCYELARDADVLVCESSYHSKQEEKAREYKHLTAAQAAQLASQENVGKLILTHFSQRYKTVEEILEEARSIFPETEAAFDFMNVRV